MKGVVFVGDRKLELRDFPDPTPGPRDVVLEIRASGMCGSDLHVYRAQCQPRSLASTNHAGGLLDLLEAGAGRVRQVHRRPQYCS